jgi:hypothetical protein
MSFNWSTKKHGTTVMLPLWPFRSSIAPTVSSRPNCGMQKPLLEAGAKVRMLMAEGDDE